MLINALAQEGMVKILSSPRITVRDGKRASIIVGTEVPVTTSEATTSEVAEGGTSGIIRSCPVSEHWNIVAGDAFGTCKRGCYP